MELITKAKTNFETHLKQNPYPGRGLVVGRAAGSGAWQIVYWIMGRSPNSQNRRFTAAPGGVLKTEPVDLSKVEDPSLIIYEAMLETDGRFIATNGDQTRTIHEALASGGSFVSALMTREREPDKPNYTPRISAMVSLKEGEPAISLNVLKANPADPRLTDRLFYFPAPPPAGLGLCLTTYMGDGAPLPSFTGEPLGTPLAATAEETCQSYWEALNPDNRISCAVKEITAPGVSRLVIQNRF